MSDPPDDPATLAALIPEMPLETPLVPAPELAPSPPFAGADLYSLVGFKLAGSLLLHNFCLGLWSVTLGSYVSANSGQSGLGIFTAGFVGTAYGAGPLAALISPFITGLLADHYFAAEKMMALLSLLCAAAMGWAVVADTQATFFFALFAYYLCFHPSYALATSMTLHHLRRPERDFPAARACGTAGWVVSGLFIGWLWPRLTGQSIESTVVPLKLCAVASAVNAAYSLWMPHTPPANHSRHANAPQASIRTQLPDLIFNWRFAALMLLGVVAHIPSQFYYVYSNVFFNWTGMSDAAAKMTLGQFTEVAVMLLMPLILARISVKGAICFGLGVWTLRFLMLAAAASPDASGRNALLYAAILLHGFAFPLVTISLQLEVDRSAGRGRRSTAQGLFALAVQGFGCLGGAQLAGMAGARWLPMPPAAPSASGWATLWLLPAAGSAAVLALTFFILQGRGKASDADADSGS